MLLCWYFIEMLKHSRHMCPVLLVENVMISRIIGASRHGYKIPSLTSQTKTQPAESITLETFVQR